MAVNNGTKQAPEFQQLALTRVRVDVLARCCLPRRHLREDYLLETLQGEYEKMDYYLITQKNIPHPIGH